MVAAFAADPGQRQQFSKSTVVGTTTFDQVVAIWGNPTGGTSIASGPYAGGHTWRWSGGLASSGGSANIQVDRNGIVRSVQTFNWVNRQPIPDDFNT